MMMMVQLASSSRGLPWAGSRAGHSTTPLNPSFPQKHEEKDGEQAPKKRWPKGLSFVGQNGKSFSALIFETPVNDQIELFHSAKRRQAIDNLQFYRLKRCFAQL